MRTVVLIPARFASTRFPGKPLAEIDGVPMVVRVARRAALAKRVHAVAVATDDRRIAGVVERAGFKAVMTPSACATGTDRVAKALDAFAPDADLAVNVQGDEPLIDPRDIDALVAAMEDGMEAGWRARSDEVAVELGTLARPLATPADLESRSVVKVVVAKDNRALYFSRAPLTGALQHIGLYAYRPRALRAITQLAQSPLELAESLEQLRWLEHGHSIRVALAVSPHPSVAVDVPADVDRVVEILRSGKV